MKAPNPEHAPANGPSGLLADFFAGDADTVEAFQRSRTSAPSAREHGLVLFTRDAHFSAIEGLLTASSVDQLLPQNLARIGDRTHWPPGKYTVE